MLTSREKLGFVLGFIGVAIFAGSLPATRLAVTHLDIWFATAARSGIAGVCALALLLALRRPLPPKETWSRILLIVLGVVLGFPLFTGLAMQNVPAAHGGVVLGVLPLATAAAAVAITGERPGRGFWITALLGAGVVIGFALHQSSGGTLTAGDGYLALAIIASAIGYAASGSLARSMPGWEVISWALTISLPVSLTASWWLFPNDPASAPADAWLGLLYASLMPQWIGFFFWNAGLAMGGISRISQVQLLQPFITVALAALVNRETIDLQTILFAVAVVAIVGIGTRMRVKRSDA